MNTHTDALFSPCQISAQRNVNSAKCRVGEISQHH